MNQKEIFQKEVSQRLSVFMKDKNINQVLLSNSLKMNQSAVNKILKSGIITEKNILLMKFIYNLNPEWLLHGREPMYLPHENKYDDAKQKEVNKVYEIVDQPKKEKIHRTAVEQKEEFEKEKQEKNNFKFVDTEMVILPVLGTIPAGVPKIVPLTVGESLPVPTLKMKKGYEYYLLKVEGDSMVDCGIHEGDAVIMEKRENPENGKICAVRVDDEHTLKRFRYNIQKQTVSLIPCNPEYEIKEYPKNTVTVEGVMIGKINYNY